MSKQIDYDRALCAGMDTNLFFMDEDKLYEKKTNTLKVRSVCFRCPIQQECMEYGFKYERYGMFGGVTSDERDLLRKRQWNNPKMERFLKDLATLGRSINSILPMTDIKFTPIGGKGE